MDNNQGAIKLNPNQVKEQFGNSSASHNIKSESDAERCSKYGVVGATLVTEGERWLDNKIETVKGLYEGAKEFGKAYKEAEAFQELSLDEQVAQIQKEQKDAEDAKEAAEKAEAAEKQRIEDLKKQYIVNAAIIECSYSPNRSYLVIPVSHGQYIKNIAQLNVADCKPDVNIVSFKVCQSPNNPNVKEAAKEVLEKAQDRTKGFFDRFMDLFGKPKEIDINNIDEELLKQCAGKCECFLDGDSEWIDGEETVHVDDKAALLGRCKLMCGYGGEIKFYTSGQET